LSAGIKAAVEELSMTARKSLASGWLLWLAGLAASLPAIAPAQEFRVDTELFVNQEKAPALEMLTIFEGGQIYDFQLTEPRETTIFDLQRGRITLLDESRQVKATITTQELLDFCLALETHAAQEKDRLFAFCAAPQFETTDKPMERNGQALTELRLSAKPLIYVAEGLRPQKPECVKAYRQFADWCARLNATRGNLPAGARLVLNQELAEREMLPLEITRTIPAGGPLGKKKLELRSEHRVNWALAGQDRKKIELAGNMLATFQLISFDEYRGASTKPAAAKSASR